MAVMIFFVDGWSWETSRSPPFFRIASRPMEQRTFARFQRPLVQGRSTINERPIVRIDATLKSLDRRILSTCYYSRIDRGACCDESLFRI